MEIDIKKVIGPPIENKWNVIDSMNKAQQEVLEALQIMQSTIDFWDDKERLELNKKRMIDFFNKFKKD
jgi:hypothetical protein